MTNQDIINFTSKLQYPTSAHIASNEVMDYIFDNYTFNQGKFRTDRTWYKLYRQGSDAKYCHYMVDPIGMEYRGSTFSEFYGGIVD